MKLIGLYIENFGGLHQYKLDFGPGITALIQPNGFGKTTLAEFIRAMFYGFPRKSKTLEKSRRQKYTPWNGGSFGGNLTFTHEDRCYRIERSFGANPKGDTFSVIDLETGKRTNRFTEEIGQELFGLDADSFERSTYLPQLQNSGELLTGSLQAKLSDLVEDGSDAANFDKAMAALKAERSALIPYRGSGGKTAEAAAEITRLQLRLDSLLARETQLAAAQEETRQARRQVAETEELLSQTNRRLQAAAGQETNRLHRQQYTQLCARCRAAEAVLRECRSKYTGGLPQEAAVHRAELAAERLKAHENSGFGKEAVATAQQLEACAQWCGQYTALQLRLDEMGRWAAEMEREQPETPGAVSFKAPILLIACGMAAAAAGTWLAFAAERPCGFAALAVAALLTLAGIGMFCGKKRKQGKLQRELLEQKQEQLNRLSGLRQKIRETAIASKTKEEAMERIFTHYGITVQSQQYAAALAELKHRNAAMQQRNMDGAAAREQLQSFFSALGMCDVEDFHGALQRLREDMHRAQSARALLETLKAQLADMEKACGDILFEEESAAEDPVLLREEAQRLSGELTEATTRIWQSEQAVLHLREALSELPAVREELEQARQELARSREKAKLLDAAMEFLQQARENLSTAYMGTIRSRFGYYLSLLGSGEETYFVDSQLQVSLERQGRARELAYFSAGQSDLLMLCMRFALVDALFREQKTLIILDDPFVNLDDAHLEKAKLLLHRMAQEHQILYLTCHSGRSL